VAIIIGIADYKNLPRADYANDDARAFYDYAIRGLGVRAENIKLLVDFLTKYLRMSTSYSSANSKTKKIISRQILQIFSVVKDKKNDDE
jgi:hypothetical protein